MAAEADGIALLQPANGNWDAASNTAGSQSNTHAPVSTPANLKPLRSASSIFIFIVSVYSTALSLLFLYIAFRKPFYGQKISKNGLLQPSSAILLSTVLAKTIEITFVMVVVVFLGQCVSRRAISNRGITLSSIVMRSWIVEPGSMLTKWRSVTQECCGRLGILALVATVLTLLYTSAASALVQPQLRLQPPKQMQLVGDVPASFANYSSVQDACRVDWPSINDGSTCLQVKWNSLCGANLVKYMSAWGSKDKSQSSSTRLEDRPSISATLDNNTIVQTAWVDVQDVKNDSRKAGRIINNVTIVVPHRGVPGAVRSTKNKILQPEDLDNVGSYTIDAKVANPILNALCVNADRSDLNPIVYETWPNALPFDNGFHAIENASINAYFTANNDTTLDSFFGWTNTSENLSRARPVFLRYPAAGNTIVNHTSYKSGKPEVYILGKHPEQNVTEQFFLCSVKVGLTKSCTTRYRASSDGKSLQALCTKQPSLDNATASSLDFLVMPDWRDIGTDLLNAMSLNHGLIDAGAPIAGVLTQLQLLHPELNTTLPSPAEALLAMTTCTVLDLMQNFPFQMPSEAPPVTGVTQLQHFTADVQVAQYASGSRHAWQNIFFAILVPTAVVNVIILIYLLVQKIKLITDLCEPLVLFILGYQSPPQGIFESVPQDDVAPEDYTQRWNIELQGGQMVVVGRS